jgi:hypothetical protein
MFKGFTIDAAWAGEIVRQGVLLAVALELWKANDQQQALMLSFLSLLVTGLVGARTASARVLERAGTSVEQVKSVAQPMVDARLTVTGDDAHKVPSSPMDTDDLNGKD